jgi:hypothetical protein
MRKLLTIALAFGLLLGVMNATPAAAHGSHGTLKWQSDRWRSCALPYQTDRQVKRLIRCAVDHFPTTMRVAMYVAARESGYEHTAFNGSCCAGVYQQHTSYWGGRVATYNRAMPKSLDVSTSVYNGRANVLVSIRMAHHGGWGAWTTA